MAQSFIGTVAKQTSVPIKTIRYYEEVGLLPRPARTASHYRLYPPNTVDRLQFIKKAQNLGLQLADISASYRAVGCCGGPTQLSASLQAAR